MLELMTSHADQIASIQLLILVVNALLHIIFAGAVAKDAGDLNKIGQRPLLVSGVVWAFATLVGGVMVAAIYWFMHHSSLTRRER